MDAATPERLWREKAPGREPLGRWLVDNVPRGASLAIPPGRARVSARDPLRIGEGPSFVFEYRYE